MCLLRLTYVFHLFEIIVVIQQGGEISLGFIEPVMRNETTTSPLAFIRCHGIEYISLIISFSYTFMTRRLQLVSFSHWTSSNVRVDSVTRLTGVWQMGHGNSCHINESKNERWNRVQLALEWMKSKRSVPFDEITRALHRKCN